MPDKDLTPGQRSALFVLMAEARVVPNTHLTNDRNFKLEKENREDLEGRGLIKVENRGSQKAPRYFLELTDRGWRWCRDQLGSEVPKQMGHGGGAAYAILEGIGRFLARTRNLSLPELFARLDAEEPSNIEALIRKAYGDLAGRPGTWVRLADLRERLGGLDRSEVDEVLIKMDRAREASVAPESNQKTLEPRDRAAAVVIGNQDSHIVKIG